MENQKTLETIQSTKITFNEASKVEKTPIMILQEICMKLSITTIYENISTEGQVHEPTFVFRVQCGNLTQTGKGNSKKKAKQAAALAMLNFMRNEMIGKNDQFVKKIDEYLNSMDEDSLSLVTSKLENTTLTVTENQAESNPIGDLLEITQKCSLRPPVFEFGEEEGPAHNKQFTCFIKFGDTTETGIGRTKKLAKRNAATKLLASLKSNTSFLIDNQADKADSKFQFLSNAKDGKSNKKNGVDFSRLKQSTNTTINKLFNGNLKEEELNKLTFELIAKEENFEYNYYQVPKNKAGLHQVLLQIQIVPSTVVSGIGINIEEALDNAGCNALNLIKLLCSR